MRARPVAMASPQGGSPAAFVRPERRDLSGSCHAPDPLPRGLPMNDRPASYRFHNGQKAALPFAPEEYEDRLSGLRDAMELH